MAKPRRRLTIDHDDAVEIPPGETKYSLLCTDADCEDLRVGRVSLSMQRRAREMLRWKEDEERLDEEREEAERASARKAHR